MEMLEKANCNTLESPSLQDIAHISSLSSIFWKMKAGSNNVLNTTHISCLLTQLILFSSESTGTTLKTNFYVCPKVIYNTDKYDSPLPTHEAEACEKRISCLTLEKELQLTVRSFLYMPQHPVMEVWVCLVISLPFPLFFFPTVLYSVVLMN